MPDQNKTQAQLGELAELRQSAESYRLLFQRAPMGVFHYDPQLCITDCNDRLADILQSGRERLIGLDMTTLSDQRVLPALRQALQGQEGIYEGHYRATTSSAEIWVSMRAAPLFDQRGQVVGGVGILQDFTERRQAERVQTALYRISEAAHAAQNLDELFSLLHSIIGELMPAQNFYIALYDAPTDLVRFPYFADEFDVTPPPRQSGRGLTGYVLRTGLPLLATPEVYEQLVKSGEVESIGAPPVDWLGVPLKTRQDTIGVMAVQTYTEAARLNQADLRVLAFVSTQAAMAIERKRAEATLRESETKYRTMFEASTDAIFLETLDGRVLDCNTAACKMLGYTKQELLQLTVADLVPEEIAATLPDVIAQEMTTGGIFVKAANKRKNGQVFPVEVSTQVAVIEGELRVLAFVRDITDHERAAEALRQSNLDLQARNEELDAFAHTVAHDLKTPLGLSLGFAEVLEQDYATMTREERQQSLQALARNVRKMSVIIDGLLLLARVRQAQVKLEPLDMLSIVAEVQHRLSDMIQQHQATIVMERPETWPLASGYAPWIEEVWANYLSNAIQHGGRPPRVQLGADPLPHPACAPQAGKSGGGGMVRFWARDNGEGIAPEDQARLFMPFTRLTGARVKGHGLGLSIVQRIVEKLGGQVGVESKVGQGSVFYFTLPAAREP